MHHYPLVLHQNDPNLTYNLKNTLLIMSHEKINSLIVGWLGALSLLGTVYNGTIGQVINPMINQIKVPALNTTVPVKNNCVTVKKINYCR
jgi:hypothetical protein